MHEANDRQTGIEPAFKAGLRNVGAMTTHDECLKAFSVSLEIMEKRIAQPIRIFVSALNA
ncbi:hypothetical protein BIWAKO_03487 [Bosea sp. BIWAKO-01]|nr:hypothetical protein BIWAKO_03487 [Bosea sp. BIWAKO-01]